MSSFFGIEMVPGYGAAKAGVVQTDEDARGRVGEARHPRERGRARRRRDRTMTAPMMAFEQLTAPLLARTPMGRFATPDEIAPAVLFLASPRGALHHRPDARRRRRLLGRGLSRPRSAARA